MQHILRKNAVRAMALVLCAVCALAAFAPVTAAASGAPAVEQALGSSAPETVKKATGDLSVNDPEFDWYYAIYTLIIRFVGIFIVLGILQIIMQVSGRIFMNIEAKKKAQAQAAK